MKLHLKISYIIVILKSMMKNLQTIDVVRMNIEVVTWDEILYVLKKDYSQDEYDSGKCRMIDFYDGEYTIYDTINDVNFIDAWNKRKNSYDHKWRYKK